MQDTPIDDLEKKIYEIAKEFMVSLTKNYPDYKFDIISSRKKIGALGLFINISGSNGAFSPSYEARVYIHPQSGLRYQDRLKFDRTVNTDNRFEQKLRKHVGYTDNREKIRDNNF